MSVQLPSFNNQEEQGAKLPSIKESFKSGASDLDDKLEIPAGFDDVADSSEISETAAITNSSASSISSVDQLKPQPNSDETNANDTANLAVDDKLEIPAGFDDVADSSEISETAAITNSSASSISSVDQLKPQPNSDETNANDTANLAVDDKLEIPAGFDDKNSPKEVISEPSIVKNTIETNVVKPTMIDDVTTLGQENTGSSADSVELSLPQAPNKDKDTSQLPLQPTDAVDNSKLAVPSYISEIDTIKTPKSDISKYKKELYANQQESTPVDKISEKELVDGNNKIEKYTDITSASLDDTQLQFVNNEAQVLILPNDDIVLGELTEEAKFELIDLKSYAKIFWNTYYKIQREPKRLIIENFINNYDKNFGHEEYLYYEDDGISSLNEAFKSIDKDNIYDLIAILNNYPVLQLTGNGANTLLHEASYVGNYSAARLLVLKGIDIFAKNENNQTALSIAKKLNNQHIIFLLQNANLK